MSRESPTQKKAYTHRLLRESSPLWKRLGQFPYRTHMRRLRLGKTLDIGCGLGRNLAHLAGNGIGVDHNTASVEVARSRGLAAYTPQEFRARGLDTPGSFDSLLVSHVLEHLTEPESQRLLQEYLPRVRSGGKVVLITPQEKGFESDDTHVRFVAFDDLHGIAEANGLRILRAYSFPLPRPFGRVFRHNEFVVLAEVP